MSVQNHTLLIVDDEPDIREMLTCILTHYGYVIVTAGCIQEALKIVETQRIDGVLTDIRMPRGSGLELLTSLVGRGGTAPFVILMTGFPDISEDEARRRGAAGLLQKPVEIEELIRIIQAATAAAGVAEPLLSA